jgi:hypothetical protein
MNNTGYRESNNFETLHACSIVTPLLKCKIKDGGTFAQPALRTFAVFIEIL